MNPNCSEHIETRYRLIRVFASIALAIVGSCVTAQDQPAATPTASEQAACNNTLPQSACYGGYKMYPLQDMPCDPNQVFNQQGNAAGQDQAAVPPPISPQRATSPEAAGQLAFAPNMIGDFFGSGGFKAVDVIFSDGLVTTTPGSIAIPGGGLGGAPGANVGRLKLTENTSPLPRDRVFINYSYFGNTPLFPGGVAVNRVTPGFEKTFFNGRASLEIRTPFANTIGNTIGQDGVGGTTFVSSNGTELGNVTTYAKAILWNNDVFALSSGMGLAAPTAADFVLQNTEPTQPAGSLMRVRNQSTRLLPFVGSVYTPNDRFFAQTMMQFDVDVSGNSVAMRNFDDETDATLYNMGRARDATWMFSDISVGYWTYRNSAPDRWVTGIAPIGEVHYSTTLYKGSGVSSVVGTPGNEGAQSVGPGPSSHVFNATMGVNFLLRDQASLVLAYATPVSGDRQFDGELRVLFNWYFGSANRQQQVQF